MKEKKNEQKKLLLESLKKLKIRSDDKLIVSILGVPVGLFKTKENIEKVIEYLEQGEIAIWPCREWDSGEVFCSYIEAKSPNTTLH